MTDVRLGRPGKVGRCGLWSFEATAQSPRNAASLEISQEAMMNSVQSIRDGEL